MKPGTLAKFRILRECVKAAFPKPAASFESSGFMPMTYTWCRVTTYIDEKEKRLSYVFPKLEIHTWRRRTRVIFNGINLKKRNTS